MRKKKNILVLLAVFILTASLCGCTKKETVDITVPAVLYGNELESNIINDAKSYEIEDCVVSENGDVTYTLDKDSMPDALANIESIFKLQAKGAADGDVIPFSDISHDKDYQKITIKADKATYQDKFGADYARNFLRLAAFWQFFSGVTEDEVNLTCTVYDNASGEVIEEITYEKFVEEILPTLLNTEK